jgi:enoyl-CoA hydratase/carnithine racemase
MGQETAGAHAGMVVVRLEQPGRPVVVLDQELVRRLEATLKALPPGARGLVLASASERVFVAGADLKAISEWDDPTLMAFLEYTARVFGMISRLPFPTVAAINGAVLGGGLELAMHCDGLVAAPAARPYPVGLPEAGLGLCPGWGGTNLLPARMDPGEAIERTASGKPMTFDEAREFGLFDRVAPSAQTLIEAAMAWLTEQKKGTRDGRQTPLRWIGNSDRAASVASALGRVQFPGTPSAGAVRRAVGEGLARGWEAALALERRELVRLRHTPEATAALAAFFVKSGAPAARPGTR